MANERVAKPHVIFKAQFINTNMPHSSGRYSVKKFLDGKSQQSISLFERFSALRMKSKVGLCSSRTKMLTKQRTTTST